MFKVQLWQSLVISIFVIPAQAGMTKMQCIFVKY